MALDWKKTSQWWYARFTVNGKTKLINLGVKIKGHRPKSINGWGDETFRISRERAKDAHDQVQETIEQKRNLQELTLRVIEIKTGSRTEAVGLVDLPEADSYPRHLVTVPSRTNETVYRKPFTREELKAIVDASRDDDFTRPMVVSGICTAMRLGDCCRLEWEDVDLEDSFISVKTAKTGQAVSIPIFPMLQEELRRHDHTDGGYVFPAQAEMYLRNPNGITRAVRKVFAAVGFKDDAEAGKDAPDRGRYTPTGRTA